MGTILEFENKGSIMPTQDGHILLIIARNEKKFDKNNVYEIPSMLALYIYKTKNNLNHVHK